MPHRPFQIDVDALLSHALLYLILAGYLTSVYALVFAVGFMGGLVPVDGAYSIFGPPWWLVVIVIILVAITLWPVQRWLRDHINDLVYAQHDDPYTLIAPITHQLQAMTNPELSLPILAETIAKVLRLPYLALETTYANPPLRCTFGRQTALTEVSQLPIAYLDQPLGALLVAARAATQPLSEADLILLRDVAQQIGIALHAVQLRADLQASRERLVIAREEERRRIRNDLHDGLAPTLSSLQLQLGAMRALIRPDPEQAEAIANDLREDLRQATAEIRQMVYDLRPPMLDELGLVGALKNFRLSGAALQFEVTGPEPLPKLSAALEVAVYRVASEAIHNVIKHAQASVCRVELEVTQQQLTFRVTDNGQSLPSNVSRGIGFQSMQERAAELGGSLTIQPAEAGGTCVLARFPLTNEHG